MFLECDKPDRTWPLAMPVSCDHRECQICNCDTLRLERTHLDRAMRSLRATPPAFALAVGALHSRQPISPQAAVRGYRHPSGNPLGSTTYSRRPCTHSALLQILSVVRIFRRSSSPSIHCVDRVWPIATAVTRRMLAVTTSV